MKICPSCGFIDEEDSLFCEKCGSKMIDYKENNDAESEKDIPQEDVSEQDTVTELSEEMPKFCPNCGQAISDDSLFCENCGTKLDGSYVDEQNSVKKKPPIKLIIPAVAVAIVAIGVLGFLFLGKIGKSKAGTFAVYVRDNELEYSSLKKKAEPIELTSRLFDSEAYDYSNLNYQVRLTEDGSRLFYPDKKEADEYVLYYRDIDKNKAESVKVDSGISGYSINPDGTKVAYVKGSYQDLTLYLYDVKTEEKEKIVSGVFNYRISKEFTQFWFTDEDNTLYTIKNGDKKEKIDKDVKQFYVLEDDKTVYYLRDNNSLCKYVTDGEKETIAKDVIRISAMNTDTGEMYYTCESESVWKDIVVDELKSSDAAIKEPQEPIYPTWGAANYDQKVAQYEKDMEEFYEEYDKYMSKLSRDEARQRIETDEEWSLPIDIVCRVYYYDGNNSTLITDESDNRGVVVGQGDYMGFYYDKEDVLCLHKFPKDKMEIPLSEILYRGIDLKTSDYILCGVQGTSVEELDAELTGYTLTSGKVSGKNTLYYFDSYEDEKGYGELYKIESSNGKFSKPEPVDDEVTLPQSIDDNLIYFKDYKNYGGDLYFNSQFVDSDVLNNVSYDSDSDTLYYYMDYDFEDYLGTLYSYHNDTKEKISDDVNDYCYSTVEDGVLYLYDYSTKHGTGELRYKKNDKEEKIDDDVNTIIKPIIERKE